MDGPGRVSPEDGVDDGREERTIEQKSAHEVIVDEVAEPDPSSIDHLAHNEPKMEEDEEDVQDDKPKRKMKRSQTREAREASLAERAAKDLAFLETFNPHKDWLPSKMSPDDYTPDFCKELERRFWRNCGLGKPAWYGADMQGSLPILARRCGLRRLNAACLFVSRFSFYRRDNIMECCMSSLCLIASSSCLFQRSTRRQYPVPLLRHVASYIRLARGGHGFVQH